MARTLAIVGLLLVVVGLVWGLFPRAFAWFGNLPGDVRVQREGVSIFIPLTSVLVVSLALTFVLNGLAWLLRR